VKAVPEPTEYLVACASCEATFDALVAPWCSCLGGERSFVCPHCGKCFCKAKQSYQQKFWRDAPQAIKDRKSEERKTGFEPSPQPEAASVLRPLILVVDDDRVIQRIATSVIKSLGYGMILAANGEEGLQLARSYKPELILTDALMPQLDGREMCLRLKNDPETAGIKVVVMTALYTSVKYQNEAFKSYKVDDYLSKPLDLDQLRTLLKKHLD
jgi:CheY-like chemotaxis protein